MRLTNTVLALAAGLAFATSASAADLAKGKQRVDQVCSACHGKEGNHPINPAYPRLAGQHEDYLVHALKAYASGARKNAIMGVQAKLLTSDDIDNVAAYLSSLPGQLTSPK